MAGIELKQTVEKANEADGNKELFTDKDLKTFTDLIKDKDDFAVLVKWFEDENTMKEIKNIKWLKETIDTFIKTKIGLTDIFKNEYDPTNKDQDIYEVAVLGAILDQTKKLDKPDYKVLAKWYYDNINQNKTKSNEKDTYGNEDRKSVV